MTKPPIPLSNRPTEVQSSALSDDDEGKESLLLLMPVAQGRLCSLEEGAPKFSHLYIPKSRARLPTTIGWLWTMGRMVQGGKAKMFARKTLKCFSLLLYSEERHRIESEEREAVQIVIGVRLPFNKEVLRSKEISA